MVAEQDLGATAPGRFSYDRSGDDEHFVIQQSPFIGTYWPAEDSDAHDGASMDGLERHHSRRRDSDTIGLGDGLDRSSRPPSTATSEAPLGRPPSPEQQLAQKRLSTQSDHYSIFSDILLAYPPALSRLASGASTKRYQPKPPPPPSPTRTITPIGEQRHPGKQGARLSKFTRQWEPDIIEEDETDAGLAPPKEKCESMKSEQSEEQNGNYLTGLPLGLLVLGLSLVVFLISIDRTIITTAIPYITREFHSTADLGWYGSSYLLTACAFQPVFGRVFTLFHIKWSYLIAMSMFMLGSLISGIATSSAMLITGRAVAGFGSAGILTGSFVIVAIAVPLKARPIYTAIVGLMFGVGATVGPLVGGIFTDLVTWRWCFYMNLPASAVTVVVMVLVFHPQPHQNEKRTVIDRIFDLDILGNIMLLTASVLLFLALEFTTAGMAWGHPTAVGLFCGCGVTTVLFITWQWWKQEAALIPPRIANQRTVAASCAMAFFTYGALLIHTYFMPIWFQAIFGFSAIQSGVAMIPYFVSNALFSLFSGIFVSKVGYVVPPAVLGCAIGTVGCGLFTLFSSDVSTAVWVGFQIVASAGFGMAVQQGFTAVQTVLEQDDVAIGTASVVASQSLGGAIFLSVGNSVFQGRLKELVKQDGLEGFSVKEIIDAGATAFRTMVPASQLPRLISDHNEAIVTVFMVAIPLGGLACLACCFLEWKSVKAARDDLQEDEKPRPETQESGRSA